MASSDPLLLLLGILLVLAAAASEAEAAEDGRGRGGEGGRGGRGGPFGERKPKIFSVFQVVRFPNTNCQGGSKNGTCYTQTECSSRSGESDGTCANGFGVCCTFTLDCGGISSENCTHFDSASPAAGECSVTICPCRGDICQLRLDFTNFEITGPQTSSISVVKTTKGELDAAGAAQSLASQCLTDTFTVTSGGITPPVICVYLDADQDCNTLAFQLASGRGTNQPTVASRNWSIKVTQYSCDFTNLAPPGCTQYFFGSTTGTLRSFNYNGGQGHQLANQQQTQCVRRERSFCRICYFAAMDAQFDVSGLPAVDAIINGGTCCGFAAEGSKGFDCIMIPGALAADGRPTPSNLCGRGQGLATIDAAGAEMTGKSVCSLLTPFVLSHRTDAFEGAINNAKESSVSNKGFALQFVMDSTNCVNV